MKWSFRILTIAGIDLKVHATFALILVWVAYLQWRAGGSVASAIAAMVFVLALFACVVLHELGHALMARRFGVRTRDIILLPIGGVARLERIPEQPRQELLIAIAGPAVNVVIATFLGAALVASGRWEPLEVIAAGGGSFWQELVIVNIFLVVFNLLPAFPMDGGRMLRALLAMRLEYLRATELAALLGQGLAFLLGFAGLFTNPFLVFIAFFVWIGASHEASFVRMKEGLGGVPVSRVMLTDFRALDPSDPLVKAVELTLATSQQDFPVVDAAGRPVGVLTQPKLFAALAHGGQGQLAGEVMDTDFEVAHPNEMIQPVVERLRSRGCRTVPVVAGDRLLGLLTLDNVGEFLAIRTALREAHVPVRGFGIVKGS